MLILVYSGDLRSKYETKVLIRIKSFFNGYVAITFDTRR